MVSFLFSLKYSYFTFFSFFHSLISVTHCLSLSLSLFYHVKKFNPGLQVRQATKILTVAAAQRSVQRRTATAECFAMRRKQSQDYTQNTATSKRQVCPVRVVEIIVGY